MRRAILLHNPAAGDAEHSKQELLLLIQASSYLCTYISLKDKDWKKNLWTAYKKNATENNKLLIIAGGDGTVRNVIKELLKHKHENAWPVAILPQGTANNIAATLSIS